MSRLYGMVNSYTLPVWFRVPGYKLYSFIFGVNLTECEPSDLREYRSMSEFFMRRLRPGVRPIANAQLVRRLHRVLFRQVLRAHTRPCTGITRRRQGRQLWLGRRRPR